MANLPDETSTTYDDVLAEYADKCIPIPLKTNEVRKSVANGTGGPQPSASPNTIEAHPPVSPLYEDLLSTLFYDLPEDAVGRSPYHEGARDIEYEYDYGVGEETGYQSGEEGSEGEKFDDYVGPRASATQRTGNATYDFQSSSALADIRDQLIDVDTNVATIEERTIEIKGLSGQICAQAEGQSQRLEDLGRDVGLLRDQISRIESTLAALVNILLEPAGLEKAKLYAGSRK